MRWALILLLLSVVPAAGAPPSASASGVSTRAALVMDRREHLTEEVAGSLIAFADALEQADETRALFWLSEPFAADRLPGVAGTAEEVRPGYRREPLAAGGAKATAPREWMRPLLEWTGTFARVDDVRFEVLEAVPSLDGKDAKCRLAFHVQGVLADGGRRALSAELDAVMRFEADRWKLGGFALVSGALLSCAHPPFVEVAVPAGIAKVTRAFPAGESFNWNWQGACTIDFDGDGWMDLFVPSRPVNHLYRNKRDGTFEDVAAAWGADQPSGGAGPLALDYDNDGRQDLFVSAAEGPLRLFHNDGNRFTEIGKRAGVDRTVSGAGASAADYDGDGWLDVFVACYRPAAVVGPDSWHRVSNGGLSLLFRNRGDGTFEEVAQKAGIVQRAFTFAGAWGDYDEDGRPDLAVANDYGDKTLYHNLGGGRFEEVAGKVGATDTGNGMGADWGDADGDGRLDLFFINMTSVAGNRVMAQLGLREPAGDTARVLDLLRGNALLLWDGKGFRDARREAGVTDVGWAWGGGFLDADGDGWLDLFVTNGMISGRDRRDTESIYWTHVASSSLPFPRGLAEMPSNNVYVERHHGQVLRGGWSFAGYQRDRLFLNRGTARFVDVSAVSGCDGVQDGRGVVFADFDNDGRTDIFVHEAQGSRHRIYANAGPGPARFVSFALEGVKGNRDAVGARVRATLSGPAGRRTLVRAVSAGHGFGASSDRRVLLPLPAGDTLEDVEIRWPGGSVQKLGKLPEGPFLTIREGHAPAPRAHGPAHLGVPPGAALPIPSSAGGRLDAGDRCPALSAQFVPTWAGGPVRLAGRWNILILLEPSKLETTAAIAALEKASDDSVVAGRGPAFGSAGLFVGPAPKGAAAEVPLAVVEERFVHRVFGRSPRRFPLGLLLDPQGQIFATREGPGCVDELAKLLLPMR